ncbi:CopG family transcriptional regulator [Xenorhabdus sp. TS4]|nr:CopG family transcriptional regulator [Xenorhabdus sp. TS4]
MQSTKRDTLNIRIKPEIRNLIAAKRNRTGIGERRCFKGNTSRGSYWSSWHDNSCTLI